MEQPRSNLINLYYRSIIQKATSLITDQKAVKSRNVYETRQNQQPDESKDLIVQNFFKAMHFPDSNNCYIDVTYANYDYSQSTAISAQDKCHKIVCRSIGQM